jgi:uncharacterized protein YjdB
MPRGFLHVGLFMGALSLASLTATGQQVVHGLTGTVTAIYPATNTIQVSTDDGSLAVFEILTKKNVLLNFEKNVKALTIPASSFTKANCQVVIFFYGDNDDRTTVAVEDLGAEPLVKSEGTVVKLDKHLHVLTIKNSAGAEETYHIDAKTLADSSSGVMEGQKFDADKGSRVRVTATTQNGTQLALFIRSLSL